jgi:squalene synthase HpnC
VATAWLNTDLDRFGPQCAAGDRPTLEEARAYCRRLARSHYENFTVASWLLPRRLRPHFSAIYAYCRWADDLADETHDPARSLELLDWWEGLLADCYRGVASHPVFVALGETVRQFDIPQHLLADLLVAFRQDQHTTRYETVDELLEYCRFSANPVGRLVLCLDGKRDEPTCRLADSICAGLQWINFCQDVARDFERGRVYLPQSAWRSAGYTQAMFARHEFNPAFREALSGEVARAESYLLAGWPLVGLVSRDLAVDVALFIEGGLSVARAIRRLDYNVWERRPTISRLSKLRMLAGCWWRTRRAMGGGVA